MTRISDLPRRIWHDDCYADAAVRDLSAALRTPNGEQFLRPIQAVAILEAIRVGGLLLNARVGAGKTLVAALLATLYEDKRPLMIVPGGFDGKTDRELAGYRKDWNLSHTIQTVTYSDLARDVDERLLKTYQPGAIICDEVDKLRRVSGATGSGTAKRIATYMAQNPETMFFGMSGTLFKEGLKDFAHLANWALKDRAPVPRLPGEIDSWHRGLKGQQGMWPKMRQALGLAETADVLAGFRARFAETPGVIISVDQFTGVPLTLETVALDSGTQDVLQRLYETGETPDGLDVADEPESDAEAGAGTTWAAERQIALGFYYTPSPKPPVKWLMARKGYFKLVRRMLAGQKFNTELQVRRWADAQQHPLWMAWKAIQPTFEPNFVPVWLNDRALSYCKGWGRDGGIVWCDHRAFAYRLAAETGWRLFGAGGVDASGMPIEACTDRTIIASRQANGTGRNLQQWNRGLITAIPGNGRDAEQLFGRQHREGQLRAVELSILFGCRAHANDLRKVMALSEEEQKEMGRSNKILTAGWR
jgi:hypothetical protein